MNKSMNCVKNKRYCVKNKRFAVTDAHFFYDQGIQGYTI